MILSNCRLIPELCEGFQEEKADIRIEGNSIVEILPAGTANADEEIIDCTGKTVLPGLFNIHTHLYVDTFNFDLIEKPYGDPAIHMLNMSTFLVVHIWSFTFCYIPFSFK